MPLPLTPAERSTPSARSALSSAGTPRSFEANARLFKQGEEADSILLIETGHVKIVHEDSDERQTVLGVRGPGDLIGEFAALTRSTRSAGVIALQPVTGFAIDSTTFIHLLIRDSSTMLDVMGGIIAKVGEADRRRLEYTRLNVERRVARFLTEIASPLDDGRVDDGRADDGRADNEQTDSGEADGGQAVLTVPLSQADLATAVGATRESCAVAIRHMRSAGLVETGHRSITVLDLDRLRILGQSDGRRRPVRRRG